MNFATTTRLFGLTLLLLLPTFIEANTSSEPEKDQNKVVATVNGVSISEKVFAIYANRSFGDSFFVKESKQIKDRLLNQLIEKILISQFAEKNGLTKSSDIKKDLEAIDYIGRADLLAAKAASLLKDSETSNMTPDLKTSKSKKVAFYQFSIGDKMKAATLLKKMTLDLEKLSPHKERKNKFLEAGLKYNNDAFKTSISYVDDTMQLSTLQLRILEAKSEGLLPEVISSIFGFHLIFIDRIYSAQELASENKFEGFEARKNQKLSRLKSELLENSKITVDSKVLEAIDFSLFETYSTEL